MLVDVAVGGVGFWLVQLARAKGLEVVTQVGSVENEEFVRVLGAAEVVSYKIESLKAWARWISWLIF